MRVMKTVLLMPDDFGRRVVELAKSNCVALEANIVNDHSSLVAAYQDPPDFLLSFGTGVIVPQSLLKLTKLFALNVHAAPPEYPGRDAHHFAVYDGVVRFGATLHHMCSKVDAGPIVDVELFDVSADAMPVDLLRDGNQAGWVLVERLLKKLDSNLPLIPLDGVDWGARKTTRQMFLALCRVDKEIPEQELERRLRATEMPGYKNLFIEMYGYRFYIEDCG